MIFVDSNVPMYLVGAEHPNKGTARRILERLVSDGSVLVTSCEVFREILHRYSALRRPDAIDPAFELLRGLVDVVFPIDLADVERARRLMADLEGLSARDALHVAVMKREGVDRVLSFDRGFDRVDELERIAD